VTALTPLYFLNLYIIHYTINPRPCASEVVRRVGATHLSLVQKWISVFFDQWWWPNFRG